MSMTFRKLQEEFQVRYYLWATSEWEREIEQSFPSLRTFKTGSPWETYSHLIISPTVIRHPTLPDITAPTLRLAPCAPGLE